MSQTAEQVFQNTFSRLSSVFEEREARNITSILLEDRFDISKMDVMLHKVVDLDELGLQECIERILKHEPVQHVTGIAHFRGEEYQVNRNVLIPRPETEELVEWLVSENPHGPQVIWDVGTGSGCIAISISKELENAEVFGLDVSDEALEVARANNVQLSASVEFVQQDILSDNPKLPRPDVIVSNPPYISINERKQMDTNVVDFDPDLALFVADNDPLIFYRRIAEVGLEVLDDNGKIYFEIHEKQGAAVLDLLTGLGYKAELRKDLQGKDRMVRARKCV